MQQWLNCDTMKDVALSPLSEIGSLIHEEAIGQSARGTALDRDDKSILIVDDDPMILMLISKMVLHLGYRPKAAADGMDALYNLSRSRYELTITDYDMPLMNGLELADQIKNSHVGTRVILMTGRHDSDFLKDIETSGLVSGLLFKPFNLGTLKETLEMVTHHGPIGWAS